MVAPRACVRVYARVLVPPNLYIHTYIKHNITLQHVVIDHFIIYIYGLLTGGRQRAPRCTPTPGGASGTTHPRRTFIASEK